MRGSYKVQLQGIGTATPAKALMKMMDHGRGSDNLFHAILLNEVQRLRQSNSERVGEAMLMADLTRDRMLSSAIAFGG